MQHVKIPIVFCTPQPVVRKSDGSLGLDTITVQWHRARMNLATPTNFNCIEMAIDGMEVGEARSLAARKCVEYTPKPDYIFFLDNDVIAPYDALTKLYFRAKTNPDHEIISGVYCCKWMNPADPLIYAGDGLGAYWDWATGDILTTDRHGISSTHMGLTLIKISLFERMLKSDKIDPEKGLFYTPYSCGTNKDGVVQKSRGTEDIYFCNKAVNEFGAKLLIDTSVLAGHIDKASGQIYGLPEDCPPVKRAKALFDKSDEYKNEKKAIDLGCGSFKRTWEGYKTYTSDIRPEVKPDYVQDTRFLNLPDNHFDLVASSHHLEHFARADQQQIWSEMCRILKPGGIMEHIVPDLTWAAEKIREGDEDEHVYNVLYGAQESHGYGRELNSHYFGYTARVFKSFAKNFGLVDVEIRNWKTEPDLVYNLIMKCRKPLENEVFVDNEIINKESDELRLINEKNTVTTSKKKRVRKKNS